MAEKAAKLADLPVSLFVDATDEDLLEAARDKSVEETAAADRLRDMDSEDWDEAAKLPVLSGFPDDAVGNLDALIEFLATMPVEDLESMATAPVETVMAHLRDYLSGTEIERLAPDTIEAAEAATIDEQRRIWAGISWRKMTPAGREALIRSFEEIVGSSCVKSLTRCL